MNPHLFVYGSLLSAARHPMGERLAREAHCLGDATLKGRLYRISWYPGAVEGGRGDERVHGEVYRLHNAARALQWLDAYEGLAAGAGPGGEYARRERPVLLASGAAIAAWVYLYCGDVGGLARVPSGRWLPGLR